MSIRMRHTRSHTNNRRSHHALVGANVIKDKETGALTLPHRIDEATGMYRGKQIVVAKDKKAKSLKAKGVRTEPLHEHKDKHDKQEHKHENADQTRPRSFFGKVMNSRPKARSGAGGGGV